MVTTSHPNTTSHLFLFFREPEERFSFETGTEEPLVSAVGVGVTLMIGVYSVVNGVCVCVCVCTFA
jgi:hypothetical protein